MYESNNVLLCKLNNSQNIFLEKGQICNIDKYKLFIFYKKRDQFPLFKIGKA